MIRDYDKKMEVILDFYDQAQEIFSMVSRDIDHFKTDFGYDLLSDTVIDDSIYLGNLETKVAAHKKQLLIQLGRIGEYALKYVLLLKQMEIVPDQTYEEFMNNTLYTLGDKNPTQNNSTSGFYINNHILGMDVFDDIKNEKTNHKKQPLHDYAYLFFILKRMFPSVVSDIFQVMDYNIKSSKVMESKLPDFLKEDLYVFPQREFIEFNSMSDEERIFYRESFEEILKESGDIFIRLRYIENNPNNKEYSLEDILNIMDYLLDYVRLVHDMNNNEITNNITAAYNKEKCIEVRIRYIGKIIPVDDRKEVLDKEIKRINDVFGIERIANNVSLILACIFYSKLSIEEIEELINNTNLSDDHLYPLIYNNVSFSLYEKLCNKGIIDIGHICKLSLNKNIEDLLEFSYEELYLMKWLDLDTLNKLKENTNVYNFILNNLDTVGIFFGSIYFDDKQLDNFTSFLSMDEVKNNPSLIYGLDLNQHRVYCAFDEMGLGLEDKKNNFRRNVECFKDNSELYSIIPFMLDCENTKKIIELLSTQGLDMNKLERLDTTVLCLPFSMVAEITEFLNSKGVPAVGQDNDMNMFFNFVEARRKYDYKKDGKDVVPLPLQHRKNYAGMIEVSGYQSKKD